MKKITISFLMIIAFVFSVLPSLSSSTFAQDHAAVCIEFVCAAPLVVCLEDQLKTICPEDDRELVIDLLNQLRDNCEFCTGDSRITVREVF